MEGEGQRPRGSGGVSETEGSQLLVQQQKLHELTSTTVLGPSTKVTGISQGLSHPLPLAPAGPPGAAGSLSTAGEPSFARAERAASGLAAVV